MVENRVLPFPDPDPEPRGSDTWHVGYARFPGWTGDQDRPYRPRLAIAVSADTGLIGSSDLVPPDVADPVWR